MSILYLYDGKYFRIEEEIKANIDKKELEAVIYSDLESKEKYIMLKDEFKNKMKELK